MTHPDKTQKIDLVLVTGYLGAGKTTMVEHLVSRNERQRTSLIVNEFGSQSVDGPFLRRKRKKVYEVNDGSIFCTCKTGSFLMGLRMYAGELERPQQIIVEASGISDPTGLSKLLWREKLDAEFQITRVICMVDVTSFPAVSKREEAAVRQAQAADLIVLNKIDLADEEQISESRATLRDINPKAEIALACYARLENEPALDKNITLEGDLVSCNTPENRPSSLHLAVNDVRRKDLETFLSDALVRSYRMKGWVRVDGEWWYVSDNSGQIEWMMSQPPNGTRPGVTVICNTESTQHIADAWRSLTGC